MMMHPFLFELIYLLIVIGVITVYCFGWFTTRHILHRFFEERFTWHASDDAACAWLGGLFWPVSLPLVLVALMARRIGEAVNNTFWK